MKRLTILLMFLIILPTFLTNLFAQEYDEYGNINIKGLSEEDMVRIFGDQFNRKFFKVNGDKKAIKESIINGNNITTVLFNYGSICKPNYLGNIADLVWDGLGYGFEFGPLAAAEVIGDSNQVLHITSDSFVLPSQGDYNTDGTIKWGWLPKDGYADSTQKEIARLAIGDKNGDGKPDSWPERWYNPDVGKYLWPAFLGDQATAPDEEVYYVVDDFTNAEFPYTPSLLNPDMKGLGLDMEVRVIQFSNPLADDIMFLVYQITNASEKKIGRGYFGMHGDPHVGGSSDYGDDRADFIDPFGRSVQLNLQEVPQRARNMVYSWDDDGVGMGGRPTGYFGWKFLESPSNAHDGIDNDDDGITDETPENSKGEFIDGTTIPLETGISDVEKYTKVFGPPKPRFAGDEDGDWNVDKDDIGIDGIGPNSPNYPGPDYGEGDGEPSQAWYQDLDGDGDYTPGEPLSDDRIEGYRWAGSEPNFGLRDISESDQIGLSSFQAAQYTNSDPNVPRNDPLMWQWLSSDTINTAQELLSEPGDNVFNFGTGPLSLEAGETQRFSMAILFGHDIDDLILNAETSTKILEADYRFAQPPIKPTVTAVPGDGRVTLYWDTKAEESVDPLTGLKDFEGYKVYRSRDYTFSDVYSITDANGNPFLGKALAQWDLDDSLSGFHPVDYPGRAVKFYLGNNSGLAHQFIDSTITDGITYYYAVVAYDFGTSEIPPTENKAIIRKDPITSELTFETNTAMVTPGGISAGMDDPEAGIGGKPLQVNGNSTGELNIVILDDLGVKDKFYKIEFTGDSTYTVFDSTGVVDQFTSKDTVFTDLKKTWVKASTVVVKDAAGNVIDPSKYLVNEKFGKIRGALPGDLPSGEIFDVTYNYYPIPESNSIDSSDANPVFDGQRLFVQNDPLDLDVENSVWDDEAVTNIKDSVLWSLSNADYIGNPHVQYRADWEIRWLDLTDTLSDGTWPKGDSILAAPSMKLVSVPFNVLNVSEVDDQGNYVKGNYMLDETQTPATANNGKWDWGEPLLLRPTDASGATVSYFVQFSLYPDTLIIDSTVVDDSTTIVDTTIKKFEPIYPKEGDIYYVRTKKPFMKGDLYTYESKKAELNKASAEVSLDNIYVVPNPYVAFSMAEEPGRLPDKRGDKQLQFRNLPPECTIRIYTVTGELVSVIYKNDFTNMATWDLLSDEGQRIAYGVYIYHIEVPDVGEKIGRFAVIK